VAILPLSFRF